MLAYVFGHWPVLGEEQHAYESALIAFHRVLSERRPDGFLRSFILKLEEAAWLGAEGPVYEDWYLVEDFTALGVLNEGAVTGARKSSHDEVAFKAAGGAGSVYRLIAGRADISGVRHALRFSKPDGMTYDRFNAQLQPDVTEAGGGLWQRQMVLGPAPEFCFLTPKSISLPSVPNMLVVDVETVWSGEDESIDLNPDGSF